VELRGPAMGLRDDQQWNQVDQQRDRATTNSGTAWSQTTMTATSSGTT